MTFYYNVALKLHRDFIKSNQSRVSAGKGGQRGEVTSERCVGSGSLSQVEPMCHHGQDSLLCLF